ncbi:MAG: hypothetical protein KF764_02960 [Labilithrix sp.]|nr:hypothetical protein [Labilithrix sp.]
MGFPHGDFILLDLDISPGIARVSAPTYPIKWEATEGYGTSGASSRFRGRGLGIWKVAFECTEDSEKDEMDGYAQRHFEVRLGKRPEPLNFYHPIIVSAPHRITAATVTDVEGWDQRSSGLWVFTVSFQEFRKAKPFIVSKAKDPIPAVAGVDALPLSKADKILAEAYAANQAAQARFDVPIGQR